MKKLFLISLLLMVSTYNAQAVSFNCKKAKTSDEKVVCQDKVLSLLDSEMAEKYKKILKKLNTRDKQNSIDGQNDWILERKECKDDIYCLRKVYIERIHDLEIAEKK